MSTVDGSRTGAGTGPAAAAGFVRRVLDRLPAEAPPPARARSDNDLNPGYPIPANLKPAAVLVPVVARDELTLLLTERSARLSRHAGQIAFPGGRIDGAETAVEAALREANEEVGLAPERVRPLGFLDTYRTGTGYAITPVVALVSPPFELSLAADEVADAFEVPLDFLMDAANHQTHSRIWQGAERRFYAIPYLDRYIWGATAGILKNMHERLFAP